MAKQLLIENITIDCLKDVKKRDDLMENLQNGKITVEIPTLKDGKTIMESQSLDVLGVYRVPISRPGVMNKNNRKYTLERTWNPVLEKKLGEGSLGLLNHPEAGKQPDAKSVCCVWRNHGVDIGEGRQPLVCADMYLINDKMGYGDKVESIIKAGGKVDLSTRGYGEIDENGEVYGYDYKATDVVYEGSYSVNFDKSARISEEKEEPQKVQENTSKSGSNITNNQTGLLSQEGDSTMINKILIRKAINDAYAGENKFDAFNELRTIHEELKGAEGCEDLAADVVSKIGTLQGALSSAHQQALQEATDDTSGDNEDNGSAKDTGTAGTDKMIYPDPEEKIKNSDEKIPQDVHNHEVEDTDDTTQGDRDDGKQRPYKAADSRDGMKSEVMSGEVTHEDEVIDISNVPVYEDDDGQFVLDEDKNKIYVEILEDSEEAIPADVHNHEIEDIEDTDDDDRSAYTDRVPTAGKKVDAGKQEGGKKVESVNLYKLDKTQLIDTVMSMDEAVKNLQEENEGINTMYEGLEDYTLRLETYTLKAEKVLKNEKLDKDTARTEVQEAVNYAEQLKTQFNELETHCAEQNEYIEKLENEHEELTESAEEANKVTPYVQSLIKDNPQLGSWRTELMAAKDIQEARDMAIKYNNMKGNVRLDKAMINEQLETKASGKAVGSNGYYESMIARRGMI